MSGCNHVNRQAALRFFSTAGIAVFLVSAIPVFARQSVMQKDTETRIMLFSFENASGDSALDYLGQGIMRMLSGQLEKITYVSSFHPVIRYIRTDAENPGAEQRKAERSRLKVLMQETGNVPSAKAGFSRRNSLRYIVYGHFTSERKTRSDVYRNDLIRAEYFLYDSLTGKTESFFFNDELDTLYQNIPGHFASLMKRIRGADPVKVRAESDPPGAMVFFDDQYLGRTPLQAEVIVSDYNYRFVLEGYNDVTGKISAEEVAGGASVRADLGKKKYEAVLEVSSDPQGAEVFLNMTRLGVTPLTVTDQPEGKHRLRISKEGYADRFAGVSLENGKTTKVHLALEEGTSEEIYLTPRYLVLDWGYYDLAFASALSSLAFYGGYWYYETRAESRMNSLRTVSGPLMIWQKAEPYLWYMYHLNRNSREVSRLQESARISAGSAAGALFLSGFFLYRFFDEDSYSRNPGEIRFRPGASFFPDGRKETAFAAGILLRF